VMRSYAPMFIFTTAMSPVLAAGAHAAVCYLKESGEERARLHERAARLSRLLKQAGLPVMDNPSHIVPLLVQDAVECKRLSDDLLRQFGIYVQPINYPTVPKGTERLRFTPSPAHDDKMMDYLIQSLKAVWTRSAA